MAEEPPTPQDEGNFFDTRSIHFRQFQATLVFVAEKPPPYSKDEGKFFDTRSIHFRQFRVTLVFVAEKPPPLGWGKFYWHQIYPSQAILSNFGFCGRKVPPPGWGKIFDTRSIHFRQFQATLVFVAEEPLSPRMREKFFDIRSIHFRQFWATLVFVAEKPPPPPDEGKFLTPALSISGNFRQLWFLWQKSPPMRKIFWHQIYPFQAILSNFGFCGRKAPSPNEGKFLTPALSISGNFRQLWFLWQKIPPMRKNFLTPDLSISGNFKQLWFLWQKSPPSPNEGKFLTPALSISGNFKQLWFLWQKSPSPNEGKFFDTRSIHFRQFQATLVFVAEKPPPPGWGKILWHQIYPFQAISSNFGFCGRKAPLPMRENFLTPDLSISGNFEQLWFLWQKSPSPPGWGKIFWHQIYPFQAILSNFGFRGRKAPHEEKFFDTRSIHFRQFWATLVFVAEKPPSRMRENSLTPDLSISGNFK